MILILWCQCFLTLKATFNANQSSDRHVWPTQSKTKSRPILVQIFRTVDITSVLTKRGSLSKAYYIKADMTQEQHRLEIILMRERWKLIQSGVSRTRIKIRNSNIYVRTNYRPISLLCCTSYLTKLLVLTNQISIFQFGVLRHNSSLHQLLTFLGEIIIHLITKLTMM